MNKGFHGIHLGKNFGILRKNNMSRPRENKFNPNFLLIPLTISFLLLIGIMSWKIQSVTLKTTLSNVTPTPELSQMKWQDVLNCDIRTSPDNTNWKFYKNTELGFSFSYGPQWKTSFTTQANQYGDSIALSHYTFSDGTSSENYYPGGGGKKAKGASLYIGKPIQTELPDSLTWINKNVESTTRSLGYYHELKPDITIGNLTGVGFFGCGEGCQTTVYLHHNNEIYPIIYTTVNDFDDSSNHFQDDLCATLKSFKFF